MKIDYKLADGCIEIKDSVISELVPLLVKAKAESDQKKRSEKHDERCKFYLRTRLEESSCELTSTRGWFKIPLQCAFYTSRRWFEYLPSKYEETKCTKTGSNSKYDGHCVYTRTGVCPFGCIEPNEKVLQIREFLNLTWCDYSTKQFREIYHFLRHLKES